MRAARKTKESGSPVPERRKQVRVPIRDVAVEVYSPQGVPVSQEVCDIVNISTGGMLFRTTHPYDFSQQVRLTFKPPQSPVIVHADAKVVHWHVTADGKFVGVQFGNLGASERTAVQNYVKRMQDS
jgi:c-di-GMP-binding flagellar brake protein YcgR